MCFVATPYKLCIGYRKPLFPGGVRDNAALLL